MTIDLLVTFVYGFVQAVTHIGAVVCFQTIRLVIGVLLTSMYKDILNLFSVEGYVAPAIIAFLNLMVLISYWDLLFKIKY